MRYRMIFLVFLKVFSVADLAIASGDSEIQSKAFHLLNRFAYGPRPGQAEKLAKEGSKGFERWFEQQMEPAKMADDKVDEKLKALPSLFLSLDEIQHRYFRPADIGKNESGEKELAQKLWQEMALQKIIRATESERQLQEVMVDFWFNHFNVDSNKNKVKWYFTVYERDSIRPHVFGKFRDLLGATSQSPAMLFYLDNFQSVKSGAKNRDKNKTRGLNENYARELLELHTVGVDGGYTQKDVTEVARAFTGWSIEAPHKLGSAFVFKKKDHDQDAKVILGKDFPAGQFMEEGERVLDILSKHPQTARFIAKKLAEKFVSDKPAEPLIEDLAQVFLKTEGDLKAVYRALFKSPEFWKSENRRAKIKTPFEFVVSSVRALGGSIETQDTKNRLFSALNQMGQPLYRCQPPTGYSAQSQHWVNAGALVTRINFGLDLASSRLRAVALDYGPLKDQLAQKEELSMEGVLDGLNREILSNQMRDSTKTRLLQELENEPRVAADKMSEKVAVNFEKMTGLILGSPEFQRR